MTHGKSGPGPDPLDFCLPCRYFHTIPYLLLRTRLPTSISLGVLLSIEVRSVGGAWFRMVLL